MARRNVGYGLKSDLSNETNDHKNDYDEFVRNFTIVDKWPFNETSYYNNLFGFGLKLQHLILIVLCLFVILMVIIVIGALNARHVCAGWRRRRAQRPRISIIDGQHTSASSGFNHARKGLLARMIARIEEFDSLTPLIITPSSISEDDVPAHRSPRVRRGPGRITLIPMGSGLRRNDFAHNEGLISEEPTMRRMPPMAPIHEGNGSSIHSVRNPFDDLDLVSIDRTSFNSSLDRRTPGDVIDTALSNNIYSNHKSLTSMDHGGLINALNGPMINLDTIPPCLIQNASSSTVATVHLPTVPASYSNQSLNKAYLKADQNGRTSRKESPSMDSLSSNLSSPMDSIGDSGSPLDTTGSIAELSDSVYMASESDVSETKVSGKVYSTDTGYVQKYTNGDQEKSEPDISTFEYDTPAGKRYLLHRIEEESEDIDHSKCDSATKNGALNSKRKQKQAAKKSSDR